MSLRDTLEGARKEVADASSKANVAKDDAPKSKDKAKDDKAVPEYDQLARKRPTAAKAKPAREAGSSVRKEASGSGAKRSAASTVSSSKPMSKDEKKAERARQREHDDFRNRGYELMLRRNEEYHRTERTWWVLLGVGFACTVASMVLAYVLPQANDVSTAMGVFAVILLVAAYAFIIGSFVYDFAKRRPIRKRVEQQVASMTDKKILDLFEQERRETAAKDAAKEAAEAAKKAAKGK